MMTVRAHRAPILFGVLGALFLLNACGCDVTGGSSDRDLRRGTGGATTRGAGAGAGGTAGEGGSKGAGQSGIAGAGGLAGGSGASGGAGAGGGGATGGGGQAGGRAGDGGGAGGDAGVTGDAGRNGHQGHVGDACGGNVADPRSCAKGFFCEGSFPDLACVPDVGGACAEMPSGCTKEYQPVCGCDCKTYGNDCTRRAAGVSKRADGECATLEGC